MFKYTVTSTEGESLTVQAYTLVGLFRQLRKIRKAGMIEEANVTASTPAGVVYDYASEGGDNR